MRGTEKAIPLVIDASGEVQRVDVSRHAVAEVERPQPYRGADSRLHRDRAVHVVVVVQVVCIDRAVVEIPHEKIPAERSEALSCHHQAPGRIQRTCGCDPLNEVAGGAVFVDIPAGKWGSVVGKGSVGDEQIAAEVVQRATC